MSLGSPKSAEKKKFVPNFNVARVKREPEESKVVVKKEGAGAKQKKRQEQKKEKKDKKERPELIQTMGSVFSEVIVTRRGRICSHCFTYRVLDLARESGDVLKVAVAAIAGGMEQL